MINGNTSGVKTESTWAQRGARKMRENKIEGASNIK